MTTVTMSGIWVQWNADHTAITDAGYVDVSLVGDGKISYYCASDSWSGSTVPAIGLLEPPSNARFQFGDGSVRNISNVTDGTSNTIFVGETTGTNPFHGTVMGITDVAMHRDYFIGLDGRLPPVADTLGDATRFVTDLLDGAVRVIGGALAPGEPIILDGTSNTISVTENDVLIGDGSVDRWYGGLGHDLMQGKGGGDWLDGGALRDRLYGQADNDTLLGGGGNDLVYGGTGQDLCHGGAGNDAVWGGAGNDCLFGGDPYSGDLRGNDKLYGGSGNDQIYGGRGADTVEGGAGDDALYLGLGADVVVFREGANRDDVWDFSAGQGDVIQIDRAILAGETTGAEVYAHYASLLGDGSVRLLFGSGDQLVFHDIVPSTLIAQIELIG